jgi:RNA polymerase sigma-70 factor (ECF subfamily)
MTGFTLTGNGIPNRWVAGAAALASAPSAAGRSAGSRVEEDALAIQEKNLVRRAQGGDRASFRILVERHRDTVYGLALRILRSPEEAEDAAQETFLRAWRGLPTFRGDARFSTWLHTIASRCALDQATRRQRVHEREQPADTAAIEALPDPGRPQVADRDRLRLERLVGALPPIQRAAITLYHIEERSVRDVAAALDLPTGTVKTHLRRARLALRAAWLRETGSRP